MTENAQNSSAEALAATRPKNIRHTTNKRRRYKVDLLWLASYQRSMKNPSSTLTNAVLDCKPRRRPEFRNMATVVTLAFARNLKPNTLVMALRYQSKECAPQGGFHKVRRMLGYATLIVKEKVPPTGEITPNAFAIPMSDAKFVMQK